MIYDVSYRHLQRCCLIQIISVFSKWLMIYDLNVILIKILVVILTFRYAFFFFQYSHFYMTCRKLLIITTLPYYARSPKGVPAQLTTAQQVASVSRMAVMLVLTP